MNARRTRLLAVCVAGVAASALVLSACTSAKNSSSGDSSGGASSGAAASTTASKDVVIGYDAIDNMDTIEFKTNADYMITNNVFGTLVKENYKSSNGVMVGDNTYDPELADSLTWNAAGTLLTIKMKSGLKFSDGTPLTSADVVYTLQRALSDASYGSAFKQYMGVADPTTAITAPDPSTVTIATSFKSTLMEKFLSFPIYGIVEKAAGEAHKTAADPWSKAYFAKTVISSGPYEVSSWPDQGSMILKTNPNYTASDMSKAPPTVTIKNIADPNQEYLALQQGQIDLAMGLAPKLAKQAQSDSSVTVSTSPAADLVYLGWNNSDPALKSATVRQALSYLIPYDSLRNDVYAGFANAAYGPAPYPMDTALDPAGTKDAYPTNVAKAKQLLSQAGVSNLTLTLSVDAGDSTAIQTATFIQSAFKQAGVTLKVNQLQSADYNDKLGKHQLQAFLGEWYSWGEDPIYQMFFLLTSKSFVNYTQYDNPAFDALITKGISESDPTTRSQISQQAQQIAINDVPMTYLYTRNYIVVSNKNVSGITQPDDEFPYFQYLSVQ
ncbi:MAG: Peptide/nickel transport system substrate-binding protein [Frankiales bacterium]|nr:Peptide/nickel transport system substrate-binding protein [Frankiales bacterium]